MAVRKYFYICEDCGHDYIEQRTESEPVYKTACNNCSGLYWLDKDEFLEDEPAPVVIIDEPAQ